MLTEFARLTPLPYKMAYCSTPRVRSFAEIVNEANKRSGWEPDVYSHVIAAIAAAQLAREVDNLILGDGMHKKLEVTHQRDTLPIVYLKTLKQGYSENEPLHLPPDILERLDNDIEKRVKDSRFQFTGPVTYAYDVHEERGQHYVNITGSRVVIPIQDDRRDALQRRLDSLICHINTEGYRVDVDGGVFLVEKR